MLIQSIFAMAFLSILTFAFTQLNTSSIREAKRGETKLSLLTIKNNVLSVLDYDEAWNRTLKHPKNRRAFRCALKPSSSCSLDSRFQLFDSSGQQVTEDFRRDPGFNYENRPCIGFDGVLGNENCPIGITLSWERLCTSPCLNPSMLVLVSFDLKDPSRPFPYRPKFLNSKLIKAPFSSRPGILAQESIMDTSPGAEKMWTPGGTIAMTTGTFDKTINLSQRSLLFVTINTKMQIQPEGFVGSEKSHSKAYEARLSIDDVEVAGTKSTSIITVPVSSEDKAQRSGSVTWSQIAGPGPVKLTVEHRGWTTVYGDTAQPFPKVEYTNLSYTVYK